MDRIRKGATTVTPTGPSDLLVLVGSRAAIVDTLDRAVDAGRDDVVIVDATTLDAPEDQRATAERARSRRAPSGDEWTTLLPGSRAAVSELELQELVGWLSGDG